MSSRIVDIETELAKRRIRRRIERLRRRIDGRLRATRDRSRRLVSWRSYVKSAPGGAVLAALGVGLALSAGFGRRRLARWIGLWLVRSGLGQLGQQLVRELKKVWTDSAPDAAAETEGADHG
jgi:hypothetical protein